MISYRLGVRVAVGLLGAAVGDSVAVVFAQHERVGVDVV